MKKPVLLLILLSIFTYTQAIDIGKYLKNNALSLSLTFTSGSLNGLGEVLQFHYYEFEKVHAGANSQFWDPDKSWTNKYKNDDPNQGDKFFLSSTWLVFTTDGYHAVRMAERLSLIGAITIPINKGLRSQKKFAHYLIDFMTHWLVYELGFRMTYSWIYG